MGSLRYKAILIQLLAWIFLSESSQQVKISLQPENELEDFLSYEQISIVHFDVPENLVSAAFKFTTKEEKTGGLGTCDPVDVTINLKSGSLPVVRPDNSKIEAKLLGNRRRYYTIEASSNGDEHIVNIVAPPPGDWYAIAYRSWHDPDNGKIKQQGLGASCKTVLDAELSVEPADLTFPLGDQQKQQQQQLCGNENGNELTAELSSLLANTSVMQFSVPENTDKTNVLVKSSCGDDCSLTLHVSAADNIVGRVINASETSFEFRPYTDDTIHYVTLRLLSGGESNVTISLENQEADEKEVSNVRLTRKSWPTFFTFNYDHLIGGSNSPAPMNLTAGSLSVMRFKVGAVYDTGGTLSVGLKFAESGDDAKKGEEEDARENVVLVGCLSLGYHSPITATGNCVREGGTSAAADVYVANRSAFAFVHVPFPEPGNWHLSVRAFCHDFDYSHDDEDNCDCFAECAQNVTGCEHCECARDCDARIVTSVASSSCIENGCNSHGRCVNQKSGGFVYSYCECFGGYRGFDCADDDYVLSEANVLARLLMLTLSNLAFVGAVYTAIKRFYYTEAVVYAAVMFFSTFYHACEAGEPGHSYCLMPIAVLQFCDFYNALLSIWVTLIAMASMGHRPTSFCHMLGVIVLAVGAVKDRTALWVFLLPAVTGCVLIIATWAFKCRQKGTYHYPARKYRIIFLPIGLTVVFIGLICYAFLQTQSNYYIVHSLWHVCVAAGASLLLPKREYMQ